MNAIEMKNITMSFGNFKAIDKVSFNVKQNEIHALIGENGAGKSTLMSVLFGLYEQNSGSINIYERPTKIDTPLEANKLGIGMVHQHFKLIDDFTVLENIVLNSEQLIGKTIITYKESRKKINEIMKKYNLEIDINRKVKSLTVAEQQRTEILKMLYRDANILIFDEPTAVLTPQQIDNFLNALLDLKKKGKTIIIITHKLDELKKVADRGTVIRRGKYIGEVNISKVTKAQLAKMMVGNSVKAVKNKYVKNVNDVLLKVEHLNVQKLGAKGVIGLKDLSFSIKKGEIVAIAGVEGNGQSELVNSIAGLQKIKSGKISLKVQQALITTDDEIIQLEKQIYNLENKIKHSKNSQRKNKLVSEMDKTIILLEKKIKLSKKMKVIKNYTYWQKGKSQSVNQKDKQKNGLHFLNGFKHMNKLKYSKKRFNFIRFSNNPGRKATKILFQDFVDISKMHIKEKYKNGMAHIPEDRQKFGLVLDMNLINNTILQDYYTPEFSKYGIINTDAAKRKTELISKNFDVRSSAGVKSLSRSLSGGNQQKFIVGRELSKNASLIIVSQPTRGLDVGAIENIHKYIIKAKDQGNAILLVSYELDEVLALADKIIVLNSGQKTGEILAKKVSKIQLGKLMAEKGSD